MAGVWFAASSNCQLVFVVQKNGEGQMFSFDGHFCSYKSAVVNGKIKYKRDILYLDKKKFTIVGHPEVANSIDSIDAPVEPDFVEGKKTKCKVLAKITLDEEYNETHTFLKYVDY